MSDVRLTATNPEDSSVVPVACNAKGELKLEEPIAPPEFDGNLDGDLSVTGGATFAGAVDVSRATGTQTIIAGYLNGSTDSTAKITADGSASFAGDGHFKCGGSDPEHGVQFINDGEVKIWRPTGSGAASNLITASAGVGTQNQVFRVDADGSVFSDGTATFALNNAGFTAEGYLWCTTRRGDTVILDATSNGLGTWADYTPPTRREQAEERIDALKEAKKEERDGSDTSDKSRRNNR